MNYEIKINGANEPNGSISLHRLSLIADSIRKVSEGALQIRMKGISVTKGRKKISLEDALEVTLTGLREGSTCLDLQTSTFAETLEPYQIDIFRQEAQIDLPNYSPVSLFMKTIEEAIKDDPAVDLLDKPLLRELKNFKRAFFSNEESMVFSNQGTIESVTINNETFKKIKELEEEIPNSKSVIINGKVEMLKFSKQKVSILTEEGIVDGFLGDDIEPEEIAKFWGKEITIAGTSHFKPGGRSILEIYRIYEPTAGDNFFSRKPKNQTIEQQLDRHIKQGKNTNPLQEIIGHWPGEETEEEFYEMLKNLD